MAVRQRAEQEFRREKWLAWHIAALVRAEKPTPFDQFVGRETEQSDPVPVSPDELLRKAMVMHSLIKRQAYLEAR